MLGDMDELGTLGLQGPFTLAYSVYSIYYSRDPARVLETLAGFLAGPGGRCVVVVPDVGNNEAWYADLGALYELPEAVLACARVGREVVLPALRALFPDAHCETLRSDVHFGALDELMSYYDACAPYCRPERRTEVRELLPSRRRSPPAVMLPGPAGPITPPTGLSAYSLNMWAAGSRSGRRTCRSNRATRNRTAQPATGQETGPGPASMAVIDARPRRGLLAAANGC